MELQKYRYTEHVHTIKFKENTGYSQEIDLIRYPTLNCQVSSIAQANALLKCSTKQIEDSPEDITELDLVFNKIRELSNNQILIDVKENESDKIIELFTNNKFEVVFNHPYQSTNNSFMIMILFKKK